MCSLLPLLLLCNPFTAMAKSSETFSLSHPPSYRATIASSELLKFGNQVSREGIEIADLALCDRFVSFPPTPLRWETYVDAEILMASGPFLFGSLWFRPPPPQA
jgi:hypothetical protein